MSRDIYTDIYGEPDRSESEKDYQDRKCLESFNEKYEKPNGLYESYSNYYSETTKIDPSAVQMLFVKHFWIITLKYFTHDEYCETMALYDDYRHSKNEGEITILENQLVYNLKEIQQRMYNGQGTMSATSRRD